jgi:uncharacterized protein (DUF1330 family)
MPPVTLKNRFDESAVARLVGLALPSPIHALNLVDFRDRRSYRLYGLLLSPYAVCMGARPLWAGVLEKALVGDEPADEVVVVGYPGVRALLDITGSHYYSWVNRYRVKGVRRLGFGITVPVRGGLSPSNRGSYMVLQRNPNRDEGEAGLDRAVELAHPSFKLAYASRAEAGLSVFRDEEPGDPEPLRYRQTLLLAPRTARVEEKEAEVFADGVRRTFGDVALHQYRTIDLREALP